MALMAFWLVVTAPLLVNAMPPLAFVVTRLRPKVSTVTPPLTCPIRSALKLWMRSLVAAFGLVVLVVFVVEVFAAQLTVTGSVPDVAQAASARCGLSSSAGRLSIGDCDQGRRTFQYRVAPFLLHFLYPLPRDHHA